MKLICVNTVSRALLIIMAHHDTINALQATGKQRENICVRASRASELGKLSHFHIQKLIFKVLVICRYTVSNFDILLYYEGPSGGRKGGRFRKFVYGENVIFLHINCHY